MQELTCLSGTEYTRCAASKYTKVSRSFTGCRISFTKRGNSVTTAQWLPGQVHVFIHGEAQAVMHNLRPYIRTERGVDRKWASSISGYWRRGRTEETFRQWKKELAEAEAGVQG